MTVENCHNIKLNDTLSHVLFILLCESLIYLLRLHIYFANFHVQKMQFLCIIRMNAVDFRFGVSVGELMVTAAVRNNISNKAVVAQFS